jgi:excisionase family DNA binding protein
MERSNERLVLSVEEAGKMLGLSRGLMYRAVNEGQIPCVRIGRRIVIPRALLEQMLRESQSRLSEENTASRMKTAT